jgi:O-antigen/teichoic acid export membrane protein
MQQGRFRDALWNAATRFRSVIVGVGLSVFARGLGALSGLVTIPVLLRTYGVREYGVWVFVLSLANLMSFMDFGVGNALLNRSARLLEAGQRQEVHSYVASCIWGYLLLCPLGVAGVLMAGSALPLAHWLGIGGDQEQLALQVYLIYTLLVVPLAAVQRLQLGMGRGYLNPLTQMALIVTGLVVILTGAYLHVALVPLIVAYAFSQWLVIFASVTFFLAAERIPIHPRLFSLTRLLLLLREGVPFLVLQICAVANAYLDNVLITRMISVESLAVYSVAAKVFQLVALPPALMNTYLWPMYTRAHTREDVAFLRGTLRRALAVAGGWCLGAGLLVCVLFPSLLELWLRKPEFEVPFALLLALTVWTATDAIGVGCSTVLSAMSLMRLQLVVAPIAAASILAGKLLLLPRTGIAGLPWISSFVYGLTIIVPYSHQLISALSPKGKTAEIPPVVAHDTTAPPSHL